MTAKEVDPDTGEHLVEVLFTMMDQHEAIMAKGKARIALPVE